MPWRHVLQKVFSSRTTMVTTLVGTGSYVSYTDHMRYQRMVSTFRQGNITCPFRPNHHESMYFHRKDIEDQIRSIFEPRFTKEYYFIRGEVASGKSRTIQEVIRHMIETNGTEGHGAPVYVLASQGKTFTDSLADAVRFNFDEHINFHFFLSYVTGIQKFPGRDESHKLVRVLDAIEKSACKYAEKYSRPVILVIDGSNFLTDHYPGTLERLQEKAKLWADENICKVVFVSNEEKTEGMLVKNRSCWSRVGNPLYVDDLSKEQTIAFLSHPHSTDDEETCRLIPVPLAKEIYDLVGGRIGHLLLFKHDAANGVPFDVTRENILTKDRKKFIGLSKTAEVWRLIEMLWKRPSHSSRLSMVLKTVDKGIVDDCIDRGIVKLRSTHEGIMVEFESKLTEVTVQRIISTSDK